MNFNRTSISAAWILTLPVFMASTGCSIGSAPDASERDATDDTTSFVAAPDADAPAISKSIDLRSIAPSAMPPRLAVPPAQQLVQTMDGDLCSSLTAPILRLDAALDITGTTSGQSSNWVTYCADTQDAPAADATIALVIPEACTLTLSLDSEAPFEGAFELRSACDSAGAQMGCINGTNDTELRLGLTAGTYYVVVDGMNGTSGDFTLHASCATPVCGDGVRNPDTEQCDGGMTPISGDGCVDAGQESECQFALTDAADTCEDITEAITLNPNSVTVFPQSGEPFNTTGAGSDYETTEPLFWPASDQVFEFVASQTGTIKIRVGLDQNGAAFCAQDWFSPGCWNHLLYVRESACDGGEESAMSYPNFIDDDGVNEVQFDVSEGAHYWVFVDGFDMTEYDTGPYYLEVSMLAPQ
jgi:hypothetical protein